MQSRPSGISAGAAHADNVYWQVGVDAPIDVGGRVSTRVGNYPGRTVVVAPAPAVIVAQPQPVYVEAPRRWREPEYCPPRVVYGQPVVYTRPVVYPRPVVVVPRGHGRHHHHHHRDRWGDDDWDR